MICVPFSTLFTDRVPHLSGGIPETEIILHKPPIVYATLIDHSSLRRYAGSKDYSCWKSHLALPIRRSNSHGNTQKSI